jgi:hypothetical protein
MRPNRQYSRQRDGINQAEETSRQRWGPEAVIALLLVGIIGVKFLTTPGVDAKDLWATLQPLVYIGVTYFFLRSRRQ